MKAFECMGQWWLPNDDQHPAAGTLRVSQSGEMRLWLLGMLGSLDGLQAKGHPIILGWVDKCPLGNKVTLVNCVRWGASFGSTEGTRENYHARRGLFGEHLKAREDLVFRSTSVSLAGLSEWAHERTGFRDELSNLGATEGAPVLSYTHVSPLEAEVPGGRLSLGVRMSANSRHRERQFREEVGLIVDTEAARSADDFNALFVYPLQNLMTFVCDRPQEVLDFVVHPGGPRSSPMARDIHVVGARVQPEEDGDEPEPVRPFQMLFTLADVDFAQFMGKWLEVANRFAAACNIFFGVQYGPPAYIDISFPNIVQALYLYHAQRDGGVADRGKEESRLKEILARLDPADADWIVDRIGARPFPPLLLVLRKLVEEHSHIMNPLVSHRLDRFASEVANTLKYVVFREPYMFQAASHGADLYWMMQKLRFLFKSCLLQELGFPKGKAKSLFDRYALYQHVCQIEESEERERQKEDQLDNNFKQDDGEGQTS
jgi:hypothetical protein